MMFTGTAITERICLERSGIAPSATEKNTANTTICRISFCAIASAIDVGIRWVRNFSIENADTGRPVDCALSGSVPGKFEPGCSRLTIKRPSSSETKEALTNQPMVFAKIRPSLAPDPIWAMPPTRVANTRGAMIILIRRRNSIAIRFTSAAISARISGNKLKISVPITMPSTIAIRMYCVNLLDIFSYPVSSGNASVADFKSGATRLAPAAASLQCSCCGVRGTRLALAQRTMTCLHVSYATHASIIANGRERHDRRRQSPNPPGREALWKARAGAFQAEHIHDSGTEGRRDTAASALYLARCRQPGMDARRDLSRCRRAQQRDGRRRYRRSGGVEGAESCA